MELYNWKIRWGFCQKMNVYFSFLFSFKRDAFNAKLVRIHRKTMTFDELIVIIKMFGLLVLVILIT